MSILLIVLAVVALVVLVVLALAATKPGRYTVERSGTIAAAPADVYALVEDFKQWPRWSPWEDLDPDMKRTMSGASHGTGAVYEWSGNKKAGAGRMEITEAVEPGRVTIDLRFLKPFKAHNTTVFAFTPDGAGTAVHWAMHGPMTFPTKVMSVFTSMDKLVGKDFEKGLRQLKAAAERP